MMTLLYLLLLPMLSGIGMLGLGPALMAGRAGAAHVVLLLSGLLLPLRGLMYLLLARRRGNRPGRMSVLLAAEAGVVGLRCGLGSDGGRPCLCAGKRLCPARYRGAQ